MPIQTHHDLKRLPREELVRFATENVKVLMEEEALAILDNPYCGAEVCQTLARNQRVTAFYSVRLRLVAHRQTPQPHAVKLIHYLYWTDLLRLSVDVRVPPTVRRAIDTVLLQRVKELTLGERISSARRCSMALIKHFLFDIEPKVFEALLVNPRLREDELLAFAASPHALPEQLRLLASDRKWSYRYAIRKALVMNPVTPRSAAASQLRYLTRRDLRMIHQHPATSLYLRRCIERLTPEIAPASMATD